jgi:hypothetical protein
VATWDDVRRLAAALPGSTETASRWGQQWKVGDRLFVWERPLGRKDVTDLEALGAPVPSGELLGVRVPDLGAKEALLAADADVVLDIPHLSGYPAVLVQLDRVDLPRLEELVVEAWLCRAPARLLRQYRT